MQTLSTPKRKGAVRRADVPKDILDQLNRGEIESITLAEILVVDYAKLMEACAPEVGKQSIARMRAAGAEGVTRRLLLGGTLLFEHFGSEAFERFASHRSDTVKAWAAYALMMTPKMSLPKKLKAMRVLADDPNAGVREWAWIAARPAVAAELDLAMEVLEPFTLEKSANLRRFASEITRPRGVWCTHIQVLKDEPKLGLRLLEPLRNDSEKYVQDSVANWLNDASKSQAEWVRALCKRWRRESATKATERICNRALRTLEK